MGDPSGTWAALSEYGRPTAFMMLWPSTGNPERPGVSHSSALRLTALCRQLVQPKSPMKTIDIWLYAHKLSPKEACRYIHGNA